MPVAFSQTDLNCTQCGGTIPKSTNYLFTPRNNGRLCGTCHPIAGGETTSAPGPQAPTTGPAASNDPSGYTVWNSNAANSLSAPALPEKSTNAQSEESSQSAPSNNEQGSIIERKNSTNSLPPDPLTQCVVNIVDARIEQHGLQKQVEEIVEKLTSNTPQLKLEIPAWEVSTTIQDPHPSMPKMLAALACDLRPWMHGPAGSGKTTIGKDLAKSLGREFITVSLSAGSTKSEATGFIGANGQYIQSRIRRAVEHGNCVLLIDEFDNSSGNLSTVLNTGLANGIWDFPDAQVEEHETCSIVIATNTNMRGADMLYPERETQGAATIDRFIYFYVGYDSDREMKWALEINPSAECKQWVLRVQALRAKAEKNNIQHVISPRASLAGAKLLLTGQFTQDDLMEAVLFKGAEKNVRALLGGQQ